jgi:hypothetical protein
MNYTFEDLKFGLEKRFIQIHVLKVGDAKTIKKLCEEFNTRAVAQNHQECYVFGQIFNDGTFGLNASYFPQDNLTIIKL